MATFVEGLVDLDVADLAKGLVAALNLAIGAPLIAKAVPVITQYGTLAKLAALEGGTAPTYSGQDDQDLTEATQGLLAAELTANKVTVDGPHIGKLLTAVAARLAVRFPAGATA